MKNIIKNKSFLKVLLQSTPKVRKYLLQNATKDQCHAINEVIINSLKGNVTLSLKQKKKLERFKNKLRHICKKCYNFKANKIINKKSSKALVQVGGALPFLIAPILALIAKAAVGGAVSAGAGYATKKVIDKISK